MYLEWLNNRSYYKSLLGGGYQFKIAKKLDLKRNNQKKLQKTL